MNKTIDLGFIDYSEPCEYTNKVEAVFIGGKVLILVWLSETAFNTYTDPKQLEKYLSGNEDYETILSEVMR